MAHTQLKIHGIEGRSARTQSPQPNTRVACCWYVSKIAHASNRNTRVKKKTHRKTSQFHAKEPMWSVRFETEPVMDTPDHLLAYAHFARIKAHIDSLIEFAILFHAVYVLLLLLLNIFSSCLNTFLILLKQCEWWREHNAQNWSLACSSLFVIFRFFFSVYNHPSLALCVCLFHSFWVFIHINKWNSMIFIAHHAPLYSCVQKWTHLTPTPSPSSVRRVKIFSQCIVGRRWCIVFFFLVGLDPHWNWPNNNNNTHAISFSRLSIVLTPLNALGATTQYKYIVYSIVQCAVLGLTLPRALYARTSRIHTKIRWSM